MCQLGREYPLAAPETVLGLLDQPLAHVVTEVRQFDCSSSAA